MCDKVRNKNVKMQLIGLVFTPKNESQLIRFGIGWLCYLLN